jgi:glycosyltransferase involved in cell wall biosynthesis
MNEHPTVACIVPLYNGRAFILEALGSIAAQTWPAREVIVVDDGSSDEGAALVARHFPDARLIRQANAGEAAARNRGIVEARADYIALLDQDDLWRPRKLELQMAALRDDPSADWCIGQQRMVMLDEPGADWARPDFLDRPLPGYLPGCMLARRRAFERIGLFDISYRIGSDTDWFMRAASGGLRVASVPEEILLRRIHGANASRDAEVFYGNLMRVVRSHLVRRRQAGT